MLNTDTKRRIDTARDILVGKVPDPKSQVEQITIALIYKFMDDIDAESEELGGKRSFFAGDFARYSWAKLMRAGLGGHETLNLYAEGITSMAENPGIPPLFRTIFNNAYLPYRDPETLRAFLKIIDEFSYADSENLGDAYEYLLSVLGTQGKLGQFRTPRHIIDFIVAVVDPKKDETVLDPACGTAGFLISAYKHILAANTDEDGHSTLTPDERSRLAGNFRGYDIDPGMVRFSLVNMYLHEFNSPTIDEYDTLTSDERWNEHADVILANPPFMNPTGGIRPHRRFSVQSKQSVVLFVDYMAQHLSPNGRAGFIVSEGMVFQSQNAHRQLRKLLVEEYLVAVVSLPAGVFNPYSGVKTSILFLDRALAKKSDRIAFFKVENDGFDLGAQRRPIEKNDLPQVQVELSEYLHGLRAGEPSVDNQFNSGVIVEKERVAATDEYNLSSERYRTPISGSTAYPFVPLGDVAELIRGMTFRKSDQLEQATEDSLPVATTKAAQESGIVENALYHVPRSLLRDDRKLLSPGDILISTANSLRLLGRTTHVRDVSRPTSFGAFMSVIRPNSSVLDTYLIRCLRTKFAYDFFMRNANTTTNISNLNLSTLADFQIPLPPLEVQQEIVAEIEGYQKVIDGARAVIDNYRPHIPINPNWPLVEMREVAQELKAGFACGKSKTDSDGVPHIRPMNVTVDGTFSRQGVKYISEQDYLGKEQYALKPGDVLFNNTNSVELVGKTCLITEDIRGGYSNHMTRIRVVIPRCDPRFLAHTLHAAWRKGAFAKRANRWVGQAGINMKSLGEVQIPLPALSVQEKVAATIEADQALVTANYKIVERFEQKIQTAIHRIWSE